MHCRGKKNKKEKSDGLQQAGSRSCNNSRFFLFFLFLFCSLFFFVHICAFWVGSLRCQCFMLYSIVRRSLNATLHHHQMYPLWAHCRFLFFLLSFLFQDFLRKILIQFMNKNPFWKCVDVWGWGQKNWVILFVYKKFKFFI